jgi:GalNAc-alpha-(1->4)-GalNAc-alpha-(1->3)-diNAcBac-PP-undecaprenol alpha-1,4-N-acetyl-D-galactosaminyltransferase
MRITFVAGDLSSGGGVNRVISDLSAIFAERLGAEVNILAIGSSGKPSYVISERVQVEAEADGRPISLREGLSRLRRDKPDFAIGSWAQSNLILILALLFTRTRVIVVDHQSWYFHSLKVRLLRRLIYPLAWRVIALNPTEFAYYRGFARNVRLLSNPVPAVARPPSFQREKLIVAVGHLEPRKNFIDAVRAMALSGLEQDGWKLAIIGAGPEEQLLRDAIRDAGLTRTEIRPPTSDLASWYNRASLTLVTARLEVFSLVLAEAMSAGVVPIAYATDGPSFILKDFPEHLVPIGDVDALTDRLRKFADMEIPSSLRSSMAEEISDRFSPGTIADKWRILFEEAP